MSYDYVKTRREDVEAIAADDVPKFLKNMKRYTRVNAWVYRLSGGRLMNTGMGDYPVCLVKLKGCKTGKTHHIPLMYVPVDDKVVLVGSQGGIDKNPGWVYSVRANPALKISAKRNSGNYIAREVDAKEKASLWPAIVAAYPPYDEYQARTDRNIPVFLCEPS